MPLGRRPVARALVVLALALPVAAAASACSSDSTATQGGAAELTVSLASAVQIPATAHLDVTVSGPGIASPQRTTLTASGTGYTGRIDNIPPGTGRTFAASLLDTDGTVYFSGSAADVVIEPGKTAVVALLLQQVTAPPSFTNSAPVLTGLSASSLVAAPGDKVKVGATASDADGDPLTYHWTSTDGAFDTSDAATGTWTAGSLSASGAQTLSIEVADTHGATTGASLSIAPSGSLSGSASVTATINHWPVVTNVVAAPSRLDAGSTTQLSVVASDADGDALAYAWSTSCAGTFTGGTTTTPAFTLSAVAPSGTCSFTATVTDARGGTGRGTFGIQTGTPVTGTVAPAPIFDTFTQGASLAYSETPVDLSVTAHMASGSPVTYAWTASAGTFDVSSGPSARWVAPSLFAASATITATATSGAGVSTHDFTVSPFAFAPISVAGNVTFTVPDLEPYGFTHTTAYAQVEELARDPVTHACQTGTGALNYVASASALNFMRFPLHYSISVGGVTSNGCPRQIAFQFNATDYNTRSVIVDTSFCASDSSANITSFTCPDYAAYGIGF